METAAAWWEFKVDPKHGDSCSMVWKFKVDPKHGDSCSMVWKFKVDPKHVDSCSMVWKFKADPKRCKLASKRGKGPNVFICMLRVVVLWISMQQKDFFLFLLRIWAPWQPCWFTLYQLGVEKGWIMTVKETCVACTCFVRDLPDTNYQIQYDSTQSSFFFFLTIKCRL